VRQEGHMRPHLWILFISALIIAAAPFRSVANDIDALPAPLQVGQKLPAGFEPLNVTGPFAGKTRCLVCKYGNKPVAMVFARQLNPALSSLIKRLDTTIIAAPEAGLGSFVVFLSDDSSLPARLRQFAETERLQATILSMHLPIGPKHYQIPKNASTVVVLFKELTITATFSFSEKELSQSDVTEICDAFSRMIP
jgi:hypothetical protein